MVESKLASAEFPRQVWILWFMLKDFIISYLIFSFITVTVPCFLTTQTQEWVPSMSLFTICLTDAILSLRCCTLHQLNEISCYTWSSLVLRCPVRINSSWLRLITIPALEASLWVCLEDRWPSSLLMLITVIWRHWPMLCKAWMFKFR